MTDTKDQGYDLGDEILVETAWCVLERGQLLLTAWDQFAAMEIVDGLDRVPSPDGLIVYLKHGLCTNLRFEMSPVNHRLRDSQALDNLLELAYPQWDGYSGSTTYPVDGYYEYEGCDEDSGEKVQDKYHHPNLFRNSKRKQLLEWLVTSFLPEYIKHWSAA